MATTDIQGREYAKLSDLAPGDRVQVDEDFTCIRPRQILKVTSFLGELCISCSEGLHFLAERENDEGYLVGIYKRSWRNPR